jgi:hypothetical protein
MTGSFWSADVFWIALALGLAACVIAVLSVEADRLFHKWRGR